MGSVRKGNTDYVEQDMCIVHVCMESLERAIRGGLQHFQTIVAPFAPRMLGWYAALKPQSMLIHTDFVDREPTYARGFSPQELTALLMPGYSTFGIHEVKTTRQFPPIVPGAGPRTAEVLIGEIYELERQDE